MKPSHHKTKVVYEVRLNNGWNRLPDEAKAKCLQIGYLRVDVPNCRTLYYPPADFRIVPISKGMSS